MVYIVIHVLFFYFTYYINCLVKLEKHEEAIKLTKKESKRNPMDLRFIVEMGSLYKQVNDLENSNKQFELALKRVPIHQNQIINLANLFVSKREFEYAEKTYLYGRKMMKGVYSFSYELASVYRYQRNFKSMIEEYLDLL